MTDRISQIKVADVGQLKNELRKYKSGRKFDIHQFNQVARLAWLGKVTLQLLDAEDPACKSLLVYVDFAEALPTHFLNTDEDLVGRMHIVDAEQGEALIKIVEQGVRERAALYQDLKQRDFYFDHFYDAGDDES